MKLSELANNQSVTYRFGRAGETKVDWGPWKTGPLFVARRATDMPAKYRRRCSYWRAGDITTMTPIDDDWAEYNQADYSDGCFTAEDYYMEIKDLDQ